MNVLTDANVFAENRLFATLDATTRHVQLGANRQVLLSDTVGFIRKLPHNLIESFKSTLDEVRESDVLVHVIDMMHPRYEDHIDVVRATLGELGVADKPLLPVFNKVDRLEEPELLNALRSRFPEAAFVSALRGIGLGDLKERLLEVIERDFVERDGLRSRCGGEDDRAHSPGGGGDVRRLSVCTKRGAGGRGISRRSDSRRPAAFPVPPAVRPGHSPRPETIRRVAGLRPGMIAVLRCGSYVFSVPNTYTPESL